MARLPKEFRERWVAAVGRAVRVERARAGITQERLGHRSGLHSTYISDLERGRRNVSATALLDVARALGMRPSELMRAVESEFEGELEGLLRDR